MAARPIWKHPGDAPLLREISFAGLLPAGATLSVDPTYSVTPAGLTAAHESRSGAVAVARFTGGTDGVDYAVECTATGSNGEVVVRTVTVKVRKGI